ncbi:multiple PDZ domain protein-like isoform X9 [Haliotis rubra]|uniref:multiple PDZ domain protein-like isoform X9 n=1 Tax=Haliotis rubra TaxID=36100 RepID=UPI001EE4EC49|nr:multiple PDZ domain protein-like isoform X9 [Haliotis rubra]
MGSEQVALVLRQSGSHVRLIVARSVMEPPPFQIPHAPVVPTHLLDDHLDQINAIMAMDSQENLDMRMQEEQSISNIMAGQVQVHPQPYDMNEVPEVEIFDVDLTKDNHGLGITIAGYVGGDNTPDEVSGIFVKGIADGSAAAVDGRVQVNDQIIEVDGLSLQGYSNHQAVEVLRKTGQLVHLKLVRYRHGPKYEKLQQYLAQANATLMGQPGLISQNHESLAASNPTYDITTPNPQVDYNDVNFMSDEDYSGELLPDVEAAIKACWEPLIGSDFEVVVAQLSKFKEGGGLGISLEGTVDVENGVEVRPHHYIRSILPDGPVGLNGHLISADELLEVNGKRLLGLNHVEVVNILKDLPQHVRLVCARRKTQTTETYAHKDAQFLSSVFNTGVHTNFPASERLVKAKSEMALSSTDTAVLNSLNKSKSRSLEPLTNLAMWSSEPVVIELLKEDKGLGFSILDYQDPVNPNETVIVIRSLVPKGVAQLDGRLVPGDRLIFVNDINVEHATLDEAVQALKGAGKGVVRIGVAKPLPLADNFRGENQDDGPPPPLPITSPPSAAPPLTETPTYELESRLSPRVVVAHRKSESADSEVSSSSDLLTSSDLKGVSSAPSTPRSTASPGMSPLASPSLTRGWRTASTDAIPTSYEKNIKVQKGNDQLGMTVDAVDRGINGCVIKTIADGGALAKDGRLAVGDYVVLVNNESMRRITNAQARAILRRASLLNRSISFTYIPSADVAAYQETLTNRSLECSPSHKPSMPSPRRQLLEKRVSDARRMNSATLSSSPRRTLSAVSPPSSPSPAPASPAEVVPVQLSTVQQMSPRQKSLASDGSPAAGNHAWGPARTVELVREPGRSLGISIVGGRVDLFHVSEEHTITGIFIKHVVENSPAGRNGTLKTGDRILEVNGVDVRDATHDEAVEIIRNATSPVTFVVQSLSDSACVVEKITTATKPGDLEAAELKSVQSFEEATAQSTAPLQAKPKDRLTHLQSESRGESVSDSESEDEFGYTTKKLQKKYGELSGDIHLVDLSTGSNGLGLSLAGNKDRNLMSAFVAGIQPESTAAKDGRITVGDELLEVNGQVLHGRSHLNASAIIKGIKTPSVKIVLLRRENYQHHMAIKPLRLGPIIHTEEHVESATSPKPTPNRAPVPAATGTTPHKEPPKEDTKPLDIVNTVTLSKGPQGLGFGIVEETRDGRHGIYVRSVTPGGAAAKDGQLTVGDQIMEVGDKSLNGVHYDKAIDILRQSQGSVKLKVRKIGKGKQGESIRLGNTVDESSTDPPAPVVTTDPKTCPITPGRETLIEIEKGRTGLGLSIVGGSDTLLGAIIIHEVYEDGAAFKDGRLSAGDQILEVNREDLRDATHDHAIQVLRQTPSSVWILMYRDDNQLKEEDIYDIFSVELMKKPGKGLGLSIVGKKTDVGVYISDIVKGGVAEADGRLMQGDQILAVNGEDMRNSTQEYAAGVLKTLMGKVTMMVGRLKAGSRTSSRRNSNSPGSALKKSESSASNRSRGKHSKNVSVDWTHLRNVDLQHDESGSLGLSIAGGVGSPLGDVPIIVANLTPTGPAARCGRLRVGDKILMINNRSTDGMTHDEAVAVLKSTTPVMLQVIQGEELAVSVNGSRSASSQH